MTFRKFLLVALETLLLLAVVTPLAHLRTVLNILRSDESDIFDFDFPQALIRAALVIGTVQIAYSLNNLYSWKKIHNKHQLSISLLESCFYALILIVLLYFALDGLDRFLFGLEPGEQFLGLYKTSIVHLIVVMALINVTSHGYRKAWVWTLAEIPIGERLLMVGDGPMAATIESELKEHHDPGYAVVAYVLPESMTPAPGAPLEVRGHPTLVGFDRILESVKANNIARIIVCMQERRGSLPTLELLNCRLQGIKVEEGELLYERITGKIAIEKLRPSYLIFSEGFYRSRFNYIFKRIFDVGIALFGLLLSLPLCLLTALAIKLTSKGPLLFQQPRVGREGRIFTLYKFRSMKKDAEKDSGPVWARTEDDRVTAVGKIIRKLRIDEIPQFINVLKNEMSFVGPRPERPFFVEELKREIPFYTERLVVKPGITGWAQINYRYGASKEDAIEKLQYDLYYIKNMSIFLDVLILLRTVKVVVLGFGSR
ncbi:MAG: TIGR03013 family XrtA/PEP-CTERM system glycosyltransferase [Planctomycetota bacterium]